MCNLHFLLASIEGPPPLFPTTHSIYGACPRPCGSMSTPAAKRRRVDAANAVLRKPFQSPVIRRPDAAEGGPGPGTNNRTPGSATGKRPLLEETYSPSSPSAPRHQQPAQGPGLRFSTSRGALRQTRPASPLPKSSKVPGPAARSVDKRAVVPGAHARALGPGNGGGGGGDNDDDNPFLALVNSHRASGQQSMIRDIDKRLEMVQQARKIEAASEIQCPGGPVDQELRDAIAKWKGASRLAADELFEVVRERVESAGGPKAWRAMQQRQLEFYRGLDQESSTKSKAAEGEENDEEDEGLSRREAECSLEGEYIQGGGRADGDSDKGEDEPVRLTTLFIRIWILTDLSDRSSTWHSCFEAST